MSTSQLLEAQCILLLRSESMILMFLKEAVIKYSIGDIGDSRGKFLDKRVLDALPTSKASLSKVELCILSLHLLNEGGIQLHS
jgi:hypothetical protein